MARCLTCREKFDQKYMRQKHCNEKPDCIMAEAAYKKQKREEQQERQREKAKLRPKKQPKVYVLKKSKPKQVSSKQSKIENDYHKMLKVFDEVTEPICTGCGRHQGGEIALSHSHIISRADCKRIGRPDLIADDQNITYHCLDLGLHVGCHKKHEQGDKSLLDWNSKLEYVKGVCEEIGDMTLYNKLLLK